MPDGPVSEKAIALARQLSTEQKADVYLYNGPVNEKGFSSLVEKMDYYNNSAILILTTYGGSANSGYRIARFFQTIYSQFTVLLFSYCKSAGTLITTGAHQLCMSEVAELGPLDVQLSKRDELWERRSGLLLRWALTSLNDGAETLFNHLMISIKARSQGLVRFKMASELAAGITGALFSPIYSQITPEAIGEDYQELQVASEYAKRLASVGKLISEDSISTLIHDYPSHDFVIDKREAKQLFSKVSDPTKTMYELASELGALVFVPDAKTTFAAHLSKPEPKKADAVAPPPAAATAKAKGVKTAPAAGDTKDGSTKDAEPNTGNGSGAGPA